MDSHVLEEIHYSPFLYGNHWCQKCPQKGNLKKPVPHQCNYATQLPYNVKIEVSPRVVLARMRRQPLSSITSCPLSAFPSRAGVN